MHIITSKGGGGMPSPTFTKVPNPEYMHLYTPQGLYKGCDQDWVPSFWQRKAGCGACTLGNILMYLGKAGHAPALNAILDKNAMLRLMKESWGYATPGLMGLNNIHPFASGAAQALKDKGIPFACQTLEAPQPLEDMAAFIQQGLLYAPVAFLNLSRTQQGDMEPWHWMTVVALEKAWGQYTLHLYDNGKAITGDLTAWQQKNTAGEIGRASCRERV